MWEFSNVPPSPRLNTPPATLQDIGFHRLSRNVCSEGEGVGLTGLRIWCVSYSQLKALLIQENEEEMLFEGFIVSSVGFYM
jgi:hypothetical protein